MNDVFFKEGKEFFKTFVGFKFFFKGGFKKSYSPGKGTGKFFCILNGLFLIVYKFLNEIEKSLKVCFLKIFFFKVFKGDEVKVLNALPLTKCLKEMKFVRRKFLKWEM